MNMLIRDSLFAQVESDWTAWVGLARHPARNLMHGARVAVYGRQEGSQLILVAEDA